MSKYIVGIDIGASKVSAAIGELDKYERLHILGTTSRKCNGLKKSVVVDIDLISEAIRECMQELSSVAEQEISEAYVSLAGGLCHLVPTKGSVNIEDFKVSRKDIERVHRVTMEAVVHEGFQAAAALPAKYLVDGRECNEHPEGIHGMQLEVEAKVAFVQLHILENLSEAFRGAGISIKRLILQPQAQISLLLNLEERKSGFALADIGADSIDLSIFKGGSLCFTAIIPFGGNNITNDISQCLEIPFSEAERLKKMHGDVINTSENEEQTIKFIGSSHENININREFLTQIISARVEELFNFIREELDSSGFGDSVNRVILTGGGVSEFEGIQEVAKEVFERPVKILSPQNIEGSSPVYTTVIGIIKTIYEEEKKKLSVEEENSRSGARDRANDTSGSKLIKRIKGLISEFF